MPPRNWRSSALTEGKPPRLITRRRLAWVVGALLLVALVAYGAVWLSVDSVVRGQLHDSAADMPAADLTLVPAAEVYASGRPSPALASRLDGAIELFHMGRTKRLLMSGGNGTSEVDAMLNYAVSRGVPKTAISLDPLGARTLDSCHNTRALASGRVAIVSQSDHVRRAVFICREVGLDASGLVVPDFPGPKVWVYYVRERFALVLAWWQTVVLGQR